MKMTRSGLLKSLAAAGALFVPTAVKAEVVTQARRKVLPNAIVDAINRRLDILQRAVNRATPMAWTPPADYKPQPLVARGADGRPLTQHWSEREPLRDGTFVTSSVVADYEKSPEGKREARNAAARARRAAKKAQAAFRL